MFQSMEICNNFTYIIFHNSLQFMVHDGRRLHFPQCSSLVYIYCAINISYLCCYLKSKRWTFLVLHEKVCFNPIELILTKYPLRKNILHIKRTNSQCLTTKLALDNWNNEFHACFQHPGQHVPYFIKIHTH